MTKNERKTSWDTESTKKALECIRNCGLIREAGRKFHRPEFSFGSIKKGVDNRSDIANPHVGRRIFSLDQEKELSDHLLEQAKLFHGLTRNKLRKLPFSFANANHLKK